jgi:hypothetical protein
MSCNDAISGQAYAATIVTGLSGGAPLSEKFWSVVRAQSQRAIELVPVDGEPGAPSGTWFRTARTDYLYYERQTSPFHQAHILLHLAARLLLSGQSDLTIDSWLVPDLDPQLVRLILGNDAQVSQLHEEAENIAILALERVNRRPSGIVARRMLRHLQPLRTALLAAAPEAARRSVQAAPRARLHQVVVEIRDAVLAQRPYWDSHALDDARRQVEVAGLTGEAQAASVEAAVLAAALQRKMADAPAPRTCRANEWQYMPEPDLLSEARWLVKVARAFARDDSATHQLHESSLASAPTSAWRGSGLAAVALGSWFSS